EPAHGPHLDVFSLGAIAYHVFSGQAPADSIVELHEKLRVGPGLRISDVMDGAGKGLQDLIQFSTIPDVSVRYATVDDFLKALEEVEDELTAPDPELTVDPSVCNKGDRIEGGFTVLGRIGKGSSSDALLVKADGSDEELVLKVASDVAHNERLIAEGEVLAKLRYSNVVELRRTLTVSGRTALLMQKAGQKTLAQRLREETRLSLDLLRRFGEELIQTVEHLEDQGVVHRDIKPENIGISQVGAKGRLRLVLFDFSLSRTPPENISAGTHPYLDPFLPLRRPQRWDLYAERFALAVTLYEMVAADVPRWGDGRTAPAMLECEADLDAERFDPHLREGLTAFFEKALRRDYKERFDNAEEMLRVWRRVFEESQPLSTQAETLEAVAERASATTTIAELGYSVEAQNVLEGMGIHNVKELLAVDRIRFRYLTSVGDRVRKEIRLTAKRLAQLRPDLARRTLHDADTEPRGGTNIDELAAQLLPKRPAGDDRPEERALAIYLGLEEVEGHHLWPTLGGAASQCHLPRSAVSAALLKARARWLRSPPITGIRNEIEVLLGAHSGVMTVQELALALLAAHGSAEKDDALRLRLATAVVRTCLEAEADLAQWRYQLFEHDPTPLLATGSDRADYAKRLARAADEAALAEPLLAPQRAAESLESVPRPEAVAPLATQRLLRVATATSKGAALSSRLEIYPRGMAASQAVRQSLGALVGPRFFTAEQVVERVRGRYPEAEQLPPRPALDALLAAAGAPLTWSDTGDGGPGYYQIAEGLGPSAGTTTHLTRKGTGGSSPGEVTADVADARQFEERLEHSAKSSGFLALTVHPRTARYAEAELLRRFDLERVSIDALLLAALREQAKALKVDW
ncbi:MAG: protein kinase domain-containing protein, partial [Gammaproteobacteria bacterium]